MGISRPTLHDHLPVQVAIENPVAVGEQQVIVGSSKGYSRHTITYLLHTLNLERPCRGIRAGSYAPNLVGRRRGDRLQVARHHDTVRVGKVWTAIQIAKVHVIDQPTEVDGS